jgi:hypothetical protein
MGGEAWTFSFTVINRFWDGSLSLRLHQHWKEANQRLGISHDRDASVTWLWQYKYICCKSSRN